MCDIYFEGCIYSRATFINSVLALTALPLFSNHRISMLKLISRPHLKEKEDKQVLVLFDGTY